MTERKRTPAEMASETLAGSAVFTPPNFGNLKADLAKAWKEALGAPPEWLTPEERDKAVKLVDRALDSWPKNWPDLAWLLMAAAIRPERSRGNQKRLFASKREAELFVQEVEVHLYFSADKNVSQVIRRMRKKKLYKDFTFNWLYQQYYKLRSLYGKSTE